MSWLAAVGLGLQLGSQVFSGVAQRNAANRNAAALDEQARGIRRDAVTDAERLRAEARRIAGEAIAAQGGSGLQLGTGSALDMLRDSAMEAELDLLQLRANSEARARQAEAEAANQRAGGRNAMIAAMLGAGASIVQGAGQGMFGGSGGQRATAPRVVGNAGRPASSGLVSTGSVTLYGGRTVR